MCGKGVCCAVAADPHGFKLAYKPHPVLTLVSGDHPSRPIITERLMQPTQVSNGKIYPLPERLPA